MVSILVGVGGEQPERLSCRARPGIHPRKTDHHACPGGWIAGRARNDKRGGSGAAAHSSLIPAVLITFTQRSCSSCTNFVYAAPPCGGTTKPCDSMRWRICGDCMTATSAASSLSATGLGVPLATDIPDHDRA